VKLNNIMMKKLTCILLALIAAGCNNNQRSDAYGNFEATEVTVSSQAKGQLVTFRVDEGIQLTAGAEVGLVDTTDLHLKLEQLINQEKVLDARLKSINAQMDVHQQQIRNVKTEKNRIMNLFAEGAATQQQVDDISGKHDLLKAQLASVEVQKSSVNAERQSLRAQQQQVAESIRKCRVVNPVEGTVLTRYVHEGEVVAYGKPLYKIADMDYLTLKVFVSGPQLSQIALGDEVKVWIDEEKDKLRELPGTISWVSPEAEFTPKTIQTRDERVNLVYAVKVKVKNNGQLKIGMPGEIVFNTL
jgi:HlyD family secretion protein